MVLRVNIVLSIARVAPYTTNQRLWSGEYMSVGSCHRDNLQASIRSICSNLHRSVECRNCNIDSSKPSSQDNEGAFSTAKFSITLRYELVRNKL